MHNDQIVDLQSCKLVYITIYVWMFGDRQHLTKDAQVSLINVVHQMITDGNLKFAQLLRDALVVKVSDGQTCRCELGFTLCVCVRACAVEPAGTGCVH